MWKALRRPLFIRLGAAVLVLAGASTYYFLSRGGPETTHQVRLSYSLTALHRRFDFLSHQGTNQCGLSFQAVMQLQGGKRLQGACCSSMDFDHYADQVRGLRRYAGVRVIPLDPYDIPVRLARQLLGFNRTITLTSSQQSAYRQAVKLSHEHGPCCCHCWRWDTFRGQAKYLLTTLHYSPLRVARVWGLEDGCGGK